MPSARNKVRIEEEFKGKLIAYTSIKFVPMTLHSASFLKDDKGYSRMQLGNGKFR